jgi:hypothetical protein
MADDHQHKIKKNKQMMKTKETRPTPKWKRELGSARAHDTAVKRGTNNKKGY